MKLYLSSVGLGNKTDELREWIKSHGNKILLITNARDAKEQDENEHNKIKENIQMLKEVGFEVEILNLKSYFNDYNRLKKDVEGYFAFCVIGGNVFVLRQAMMLSGFDKYLKMISRDNRYLYIGYSAGSCVLANSLVGLELIDLPINPYSDAEVIYQGIGLISYSIAPHYKSEGYHKTKLVDEVVKYFQDNKINYKTLRDGEVLIEDLN